MGSDLTIRSGLGLAKSERQALVALRQAQYDGAIRTARGVAKAQAVTYVSRQAIDGFGRVAAEAEVVISRSPWAAAEAADLVHRAGRALGQVIDETGRW